MTSKCFALSNRNSTRLVGNLAFNIAEKNKDIIRKKMCPDYHIGACLLAVALSGGPGLKISYQNE
jgi:hypothetical protein